MSASRCVFCGVTLQSGTARCCIGCFKKYTRTCPTCVRKGRLIAPYRKWQRGDPPNYRQEICPTCNGLEAITDWCKAPPKRG